MVANDQQEEQTSLLLPREAPGAQQGRKEERDDGSAADRQALAQHGNWKAFVYDSFTMMFGATQLGYAMGRTGFFWGFFWLGFSVLSTWVSGHLIGEMCIRANVFTFADLGQAAMGRHGRHFALMCQWSGYYLVGVVQVAYSGASWDQAFSMVRAFDGVCQWQWMIVSAAFMCIFVQIPSFTEFGSMAAVCMVATLYMSSVFVGEIASHGRPYTDVCYSQWTTVSMLTNVCNMAFTFAGHGTFPEQIRELRDPRDFHFGFNVLYGTAMPLYVAIAFVSFWAFGNMNSANYMENMPSDSFVRAGIIGNLIISFPMMALNQIVLFLQIEMPLGILPTDWLTNRSKIDNPAANYLRASKIPPVVIRAGFRVAYVGSLLFWAELLIGAGLAIFQNMAGALGLCATTYWLPFVFAIAMFRDELPPWKIAFFTFNALVGLFITLTGIYFNAAGLTDTSFQFFRESTCKEGAEFWGNDMWDRQLSETSTAYETLVVGCCQEGTMCGD